MALSPPANTDMATKQDLELAVATLRAELTGAMHRSELRVMGVIVLAFLGTNLIG